MTRGGFLCLFLSTEWLGVFFLTSLPVADTVHNSRTQCSEVVSYTNHGLHTAETPRNPVVFSFTGGLIGSPPQEAPQPMLSQNDAQTEDGHAMMEFDTFQSLRNLSHAVRGCICHEC